MTAPVRGQFQELGVTGLEQFAGSIAEEWLPRLQGELGLRVWKEMRDNDPIVGAVLHAMDTLIRGVTWREEAADDSLEARNDAQFLGEVREDMCYDEETEILAKRGWLRFAELRDTDLVAQRSTTGYLEYVRPARRHVFDFDGELMGNQGDSVDFLVTPNHRMFFASQSGRKPDYSKQRGKFQVHKCEDIFNRPGWVTKQVRWRGTECHHTLNWLEFLGFFVADGHASRNQVYLIQKQRDYVDDLVARVDLVAQFQTRSVNNATQWVYSTKDLATELRADFGARSREKRLPQWLKNAVPTQLRAFLRGFAKGDGWTDDTGLVGLYTSSRRLADDLQEIAGKAGYATTLLTRRGSPASFAPGVPNYRVSLWTGKTALFPYLHHGRNWYKKRYKGKVYCVSVPSGIVFVRRNGKPLWCGNSHSWTDFISEVLTMLPFGWSYFEEVYKRRSGPNRDSSRNSRFNDGKIGLRKLAIRSQESLVRWKFDDEGGLEAMVQRAAPRFELRTIPIAKALLFRTVVRKGNPEGRPVLRNAYRPWYFKKRLEEIEAIGIERDLAGYPVAHVPPQLLHADASADDKVLLSQIKKIVKNVRWNDQAGIVFPLAYDEDGRKLYELELLTTGGRRAIDGDKVIQRYDRAIAMSVLADVILIGHEKVGSFALASSKTALLAASLGAYLDHIEEVLNRHLVPRLFRLNGHSLKQLPVWRHGDIETVDLGELGTFVSDLAGAGAPLFGGEDEGLLRTLLQQANLPVPTPEA